MVRLIYPIGQSFVTTGEFGVWRKLRASVIDNLIFYGIAGVVGVGFFIGLFFYEGRDLSTAISVALALATVWGTFLLVVFMGVGLVEIPRTCWRNANFHVMLRYYQFKLTAQHEELNQAHTEITTVEKLIKNLDDNVPISDPNRSCVDTLIAECPPDYALLEKGEGKVKTGYGDIVELHSRLISAKHNWNQATTLYETTLKRAFKLDDIVAAKDELRSTRMIKWTYKPARRFRFKLLTDVVNFMEWLWLTKIAEWFWRVASVLLAIASLLLIFCEVTMFVVFLEAPTGRGLPATISPLTLLVRSADLSPLGIQLISLAVVAYMATCTFSSLFSFRFLSWYKLLPDQQTDSYSILFCAAYLSRLAPPLVLNLLYLINYDLPEYNSAYIQIMGPMTRVPFFGQKFNVIFPCLIVFMSVATLFSCWSRIMSCLPCCRSRSFSYDEWDDDEQVESGRDLISKERAQRRRGVAAEMRNQDPNIAVDLENQNEIDEVDRRRGAGRSTRPPAATTSGPSSSSSSSSTSAAGTGSSSSRFREKYVPGSYSKGKSSAASTAAPVSGGSGGGFLSLFSRGNQTSELQSGGTPAGSGPRPTFVADDPFSVCIFKPSFTYFAVCLN
jgi:hypothetical protein